MNLLAVLQFVMSPAQGAKKNFRQQKEAQPQVVERRELHVIQPLIRNESTSLVLHRGP